jgi:hypothetical protein
MVAACSAESPRATRLTTGGGWTSTPWR